jgi:putative FmdB family regulatory protein
VPTYSYRCTECDNAFDIHQEFTDSTLTECPVCGGKLRKVFSAVGVSFTGSGFYRNDSRSTTSSSSPSTPAPTTPATPAPAAAAPAAPSAPAS